MIELPTTKVLSYRFDEVDKMPRTWDGSSRLYNKVIEDYPEWNFVTSLTDEPNDRIYVILTARPYVVHQEYEVVEKVEVL